MRSSRRTTRQVWPPNMRCRVQVPYRATRALLTSPSFAEAVQLSQRRSQTRRYVPKRLSAKSVEAPTDDFNAHSIALTFVVEVEDRATEILVLASADDAECQTETSNRNVVVFPGNPGIPSYYKDFCVNLWELDEGENDVLALGWIGHSESLIYSEEVFTLQDQIKHSISFVEQHCAAQDCTVTLCGHSIGAYIALETMRKCPHLVDKVVGIHPFLSNNLDSPIQRLFNVLVHNWLVVSAVTFLARALSALPAFLRKFFLSPILRLMDSNSVGITQNSMCTYRNINNMLYMGKHEFDDLAGPPDWEFLGQNAEKIEMVFTVDDYWAPISLKEEIDKRFPSLKTTLDPRSNHMFCVTEDKAKEMAEIVHKML